MKLRLEAGIIAILGIICLPIFLSTPLITIKGEFVSDTGDPLTSYDFEQTIQIYFSGNGKVFRNGVVYNEDVNGLYDELEHGNWETAGYPFSYETKIVTITAIVLIIISSAMLMFAVDKKILKWIGLALAILGGLSSIIGQILLLDFGDWVINDYYTLPEYDGGYGIGFIFTIIIGALVITCSILYIFIKPLKIIETKKAEST